MLFIFMYELRIKFNDGEFKKWNYSSIERLNKAEKTLLKLNKDIIKMYAKYEIVNCKYNII